MARFYNTDIKIFRIDDFGEQHPLPCAFYASKPKFGWTLPEGVEQVAFRFEMRTRYPKNYVRDGVPVNTCAYFSSGRIASPLAEYKCETSITTRLDNGVQETIGTWLGTCEVRLTVFDSAGNEHCTHARTTTDTYDFEAERQYKKWGSHNNAYYFCFDNGIMDERNLSEVSIHVSELVGSVQSGWTCTLQISDLPLFGDDQTLVGELQTASSLSVNSVVVADVVDQPSGGASLSSVQHQHQFIVSYGKTYYYRARTENGGDSTEWSDVKAFRVIKNSIPICTIVGTRIPEERPNGEVVVTIRVDDGDHAYVKAWLAFSMRIDSQSDADKMGGLDGDGRHEVDANPYSNGNPPAPLMSYNENTAGKFIRAVTKESLVRIPTNRDIDVTWQTITDNTYLYTSGKILQNVYLYLFAYDGSDVSQSGFYPPNTASTPNGLTIDNEAIAGNPAGDSINSIGFKIFGDIGWTMNYAILPDTMQRALMVHTLEFQSTEGEEQQEEHEDEEQKTTGEVGYVEGGAKVDTKVGSKSVSGSYHNWYELYKTIEDTLGLNYLQRTTQEDGFSVYRYSKYNTYYPSAVACENRFGDEIYKGVGTPTVFRPDESTGAESTDSQYATHDTIACHGFVSFCPRCNDLRILKTVVRLADGRLYEDTYDNSGRITVSSLVNAFGENGERFDGTPYSLMFKCEGCGTLYPMDLRYHTHMSTGVYGSYLKDDYAYWHGYNSDYRLEDNGILQQQLKLTRKQDYERLVEEWKKEWVEQYCAEHGVGEDVAPKPKDEDCPYVWVDITRIQYADGEQETPSSDNAKYNTEEFGFIHDDALLRLDPRPEFDAYMKVVPPEARVRNDRIYDDGSKLNASIEKDYMHDFETKGDGQEAEEGDKALVRLAKQGPWWVQNRMMYQFFEGRKSIASVKDGYLGANSYGEEEQEEEEDEGMSQGSEEGTPQPINGVKEYNVLGLAKIGRTVNEGVSVVNRQADDGTWWSTLFNRMSCSGNVQFPMIVQRDVNDRFEYVVNDELRVSGSILPDGVDEMYIDFPYEKGERDYEHEGEESSMSDGTEIDQNIHRYYCNKFNDSRYAFMNALKRMFEPVFNFDFRDSSGESTNPPFLKTFSYTMVGDLIETIQNDDNGKNVNVVTKTIAFTLYGSTKLDVEGLKERRYRKFELVRCDKSCYRLFGVVPYATFQTASDYIGKYSQENGYYDGTPLLKMGSFPSNPGIKEDVQKDDGEEDYAYYYTERSTTKHKYDVEESPVDNDVEEFLSYTEEVEGRDKPRNVVFRKPNRNESQGEPLFTCYKDEVDSNGFHFRFTPEDYAKTGKIYVRRYHVEACNPFPLEGYGYRNWIPVPIDGKPGRYRKKQVFNTRGAVAVPKPIQVEVSSGGPIVTEIGWFPSDNDNAEPLSHERSSSQEGQQQQSQEKIYKRRKDYVWRNETLPKTCVVFDYVDISEAMCKNPFTPEGESPLNHVCPINFGAGIFKSLMIDRYGVYVLGGYDLTDQQKSLQDDGMPYTKDFEYVDGETGETTVVTETLPNNWRPTVIDSVFDSVEGEKRSVDVVDLTKKNPSIDPENPEDRTKLDYATKTVDTYVRYKQAWDGKIEPPTNPVRELSQQTVEQFNPALRASFSIWEKYGYQPMKTTQQYFKEDEDGMYVGKYIPMSSKIVHGIYRDPVTGEKGDPYADQRIIGEVMRERHIISDKTFMKVDDTYDKLPFLDYRVVGKSVYQVLPYFSGYPRSEHPLYATRPEPPYPYDRQWRIGGWRMYERDLFKQQKDEAEARATENAVNPSNNGYYKEPMVDMEIGSGAQIGELSEYTSNSFLYLQQEWNSFNRLHWSADTGSAIYLCLVAQRRDHLHADIGNPFTVRTRNSFWNENISVADGTRGAWCIKYDGTLSDMVDMSETTDAYGNPMFIDGEPYIFMLKSFTEQSDGQINDNGYITSREFSISETAVSPATIVGTDYDPWTKVLTIQFRFDDALGRDYDIVGFQYIENDYNLVPLPNGGYQKEYVTEDEFITPGGEGSNGTGVLIGNLLNLASNPRSDNLVSDELLITHTVKVNLGTLGIKATANMRIKLLSALSSDRLGLTVPVFTVKMWANEFLKPVEEQIMSLQGYKTQWKWVETYDESTGRSSGKWTFLDNDHAIRTIGKIQETANSVRAMSDKFETWYGKACKFCPEAVGDIDSFEVWLKNGREWDGFYYGHFFLTYLVWNSANGYYDDYMEYASTLGERERATTKARKWLQYKGLEDEYESWYKERRLFLLMSYKGEMSGDSMSSFANSVKTATSLSDEHIAFAESKKSEYLKYFGYSDEDESVSVTAGDALAFIEGAERQREFISYYANKNLYADTRFLERALVMCQMFGVATSGMWEGTPSDAPFAGEYESWLPTSGHASAPLSDRYQVFIATALGNQKKTQLIQSYSAEAVVTDERYSDTPIATSSSDVKKATISDIGRSLAFSSWLQAPSGNGSTNSQKWQALSNTLVSYRKLLARCLNEKNMLESDFRRDLVRQGYFCNGFLENQPYTSSGESQNVNTCFRWRVETRQYEGSMDVSQDSQTKAYGSYDDRYDMYYHFQMDFFDTFNSQEGGKPVTDIIFIRDGETDDCRILAGIDDADNSARTAPVEDKNSDNTNYVPRQEDLVVERTGNEHAQFKSSSNVQDLRFTAIFGLPLAELPHVPKAVGEGYDRDSIQLPEPWRQAWDEEAEPIPEGQEYEPKDIDFKGVYHWRVAPYNLLDVPCFETLKGGIRREGGNVVIDGIFHSDQILACRKPNYLYYATSRPNYPVWRRNASCQALENKSQYERPTSMSEGEVYIDWMDRSLETRGDVQFLTDRPRKVDYVESQTEVPGEAESYLISNQSGFTRLPDRLYGTYNRVSADVFSKNGDYCIYKATMDGNDYWFIGTVSSSTETQNGSWLYRMDCQYPEFATKAYGKDGGETPVSIFASFGSSVQQTVQKPVLSYIKDNLGNYDTQWIPFNPERRKPSVVRFNDQYLMFTHKKTGTAVNGDVAYPANVITMSRGYSSDVFGEEGMCLPKYTFESVGDYVKDIDGLDVREAVSAENPCVVGLADGIWRMYFNAVFFDGAKYYSKIFKADTADFVDWTAIGEVSVSVNGTSKTDYYQPNVMVSYNGSVASFEMYAVSTDHYYDGHEQDTATFTTIKRLTSSDGTSFVFAEEIHEDSDGLYNICSPCIVKLDDTRKRLYFTIESARTSEDSAVAGIIGSIEWDSTNGWRTAPYNGLSRIILEKADDGFTNTVNGLGRVFSGYEPTSSSYLNPCVVWDYFNGAPVLRMYYNTYDHPHAYSNGSIDEIGTLNELVIKTDYLDEWNWSRVAFPNTDISATENGAVFAVPQECASATVFMARIVPTNYKLRCMAQSRWIGFDNVANTEAILLPEVNNEIDYSLDKYSPLNWVAENGLLEEYNTWRDGEDASNENALLWLMETRNYPKYLWWSRKGPGIYRYVGYDAIKDSEWKGKVKESV